jgi:acyl-CoA reductase-like NAD-dependent aldehyde dehydrogenase
VRAIAELLRERRDEASKLVAAETGKPLELAHGETDAAIEMGLFVAGEGRRSYGRTTTASMPHRTVLTLRRPVGVAALLISFNTPLPNVAWKAFPSILCGNGSVLKPSEHTPVSAWWFGRLCLEAGLPPDVLNVLQGLGSEAGQPLVEDSRVDLVSFTGSAGTGRLIAEATGRRLAKTVLELGGKNALVAGGGRTGGHRWAPSRRYRLAPRPDARRGRRGRRAAFLRGALRPGRGAVPRRRLRRGARGRQRNAVRLTAAVHTASLHRAILFAERAVAGVVVVNAGTHGSEPHMGFGGVKASGTGWKEAGVEALDVYSETQYVNLVVDPASV